MHTTLIPSLLLGVLAFQVGFVNGASDDEKVDQPCTTRTNTGSFVDLRPLSVALLDPNKKLGSGDKTDSWPAKGQDYKANFTLNFCAPVVEELEDVVGVDEKLWQNVSAYYEDHGKTYSIGQQSSTLISRGRSIVLEYINGSPCGDATSKRSDIETSVESRKVDKVPATADSQRRKSTTIAFLCEKDPLAAVARISFIGTDVAECAYFFIVHSSAACGGAEPAEQGVGPGAVFGIIAVIAVLVYFLGGIMYQRSVAHARGWRQLPNYSMWAGIGGFIQDMFIIATSSCARCLPGRRGYRSISVSADGNGGPRGRSGRPDDENRLIDQLDEEWDD